MSHKISKDPSKLTLEIIAHYKAGALDSAHFGALEMTKVVPHHSFGWKALGTILISKGLPKEALAPLSEATRLSPNDAEALNTLGNALFEVGLLNDALGCYRRAIKINPKYVHPNNNLGNIFRDYGRLAEAASAYRKALSLQPNFYEAHSNLLFCLNYFEGLSAELSLQEAMKFGQTASKNAPIKYSTWKCEAKPTKLRIGFVSGDFRSHPVGYFLEGLISHINKNLFDLVAFTTSHVADDLTLRIKPFFNDWASLYGKTDLQAAEIIHDQAPHILIDLSGHTAQNRLPVFACKPAPIQITWLGYFATTGLPEMDYILASPYAVPPGEEHHFTEKVWRLPETSLCFTPPQINIPVNNLPAITNGYITFGCFNNLTKVNDQVVSTWASILKRVPNSKLFLKAKQLADQKAEATIAQAFINEGIDRDRLILEGPANRSDYFHAYHRVDITLDPFPFPGGTTSAEGLWMGVPVLTLAGDRFISHQGEAIVHNVGLSDWVASNIEDYISKASAFASNLPALADLRKNLRQQALQSPLFDANRFASNFQYAMQQIWGG